MAQVIIVSNRLPVSVKKENGTLAFFPSVGGLSNGLSSYVKDRNNIWIGWPGLPSDDLTEQDKRKITSELKKHNCAPVFLTQHQLDDFYNGYSNTVLWPLCHNLRLTINAQHAHWWQSYRQVNKQFADVVTSMASDNSTIWVHDYQLLLVPGMLRAALGSQHIGFFMHIPFPDPKTFNKLPEAKRLIEGVLGADLVGFHTEGYVSEFLDNCRELTKYKVNSDQITVGERIVRAADFPMGIDYERYAAAGRSAIVKAAVKQYRHKYRGYKLIVTVDRLDPSKGLLERLIAYKEFLLQNPQFHGKVILCMVAAPSRTEVAAYKNLKKHLDSSVAAINNEFGTSRWQPIDYIPGLPFEEVTALFRVADVALIAPLRDGMNLVAKEFIASKKEDGVLILSETAGAAQELQDALLVNPKYPATVVRALTQALTMPQRELRQRLKHMQRHLATHTVHTWANSFMQNLSQPLPNKLPRTKTLTTKLQREIITAYRKTSKHLLLLDYDGTLAPLAEYYMDDVPKKSLLDLIQTLANDDRNEIIIISGRSRKDLNEWFGHLPITLIAEHGAFVRKRGNQTWADMSASGMKWKTSVRPILDRYTERTPGAVVEEKAHSLVWHYRQSPAYYAQKNSVIIKRLLKPLLKQYGLVIYNGSKILEIRDPELNKGTAVAPWLGKDYDFMMAIGDDTTDEDMFKVLPTTGVRIKVGSGRTSANFRVASDQDVRRLLELCTH